MNENQIKLKKAWDMAPVGAKTIVYKKYTQQNISDIIAKGRKKNEEEVINALIREIKRASAKVLKSVSKQNEKLQEL